MALVLDTGVLLAAFDIDDRDHRGCADLLSSSREELVVPAPVLVETDQMLGKRGRLDAWVALAERITQGGYHLYEIDAHLLTRAAMLQQTYADLRLGFVDAAVFVTCVELGEDKVATLDRRHFSVLRTEDGRALEIVPA